MEMGLESKGVALRRKQETKCDLSSVMGCLIVPGHLLRAGCSSTSPLCWDEPFLLAPLLGQESRAQDRRTGGGCGMGSLGCAASWLLLLPTSSPCARVCCLHGAWRQFQELCSFSVLCLKFFLGIMTRTCLVLRPWLQRHLSVGLRPRLVSLDVSEKSQTWNKVFAQTCC